jgi:queuosine biosynthesis protein QueD
MNLVPGWGEISVEFTFDAGHRIVGHQGKCARLHGHTYKVRVMAEGPVEDPGFVVDFGDVKDVVNEWDHRLLLWNEDPLLSQMVSMDWMSDKVGIVLLSFNPTAENMAHALAQRIAKEFQTVTFVELWETPGCMARAMVNGAEAT